MKMKLRKFSLPLLLAILCVQFAQAYSGGAPTRFVDGQSDILVAFSPSQEAVALVKNTIDEAAKTVQMTAYSFTSQKIADSLIDAHRRGIDVRIILDKSHAKREYPAVQRLYEAGIKMRINRKYAIMHNKYMIIDDKNVETGSFNYTRSAEVNNAENVLVIRNNPGLAAAYSQNWQKLWDEAEEY